MNPVKLPWTNFDIYEDLHDISSQVSKYLLIQVKSKLQCTQNDLYFRLQILTSIKCRNKSSNRISRAFPNCDFSFTIYQAPKYCSLYVKRAQWFMFKSAVPYDERYKHNLNLNIWRYFFQPGIGAIYSADPANPNVRPLPSGANSEVSRFYRIENSRISE